MKKSPLILCALALISLGACQTNEWGQKQTVGTGLGAVVGGLAGSQIGSGSGRDIAIGAGVLLGALAGSEVGRSLDRADQLYMQRAQTQALSAPVGETIYWNNPESPNSGSYKTVRDGVKSSGEYCREFQQTITVDGREQSAYGTACQQPDGSWKIVN